MSSKKCCVPGCEDSGSSHKRLHGFPKPTERQRFNAWIMAIGGDILGLDNEYIYKHRRVCHAHFEEKYCCRYDRISNIAIPTLNLPGPLSLPVFTHTERRPLRQIDNYSRPSTSADTSDSFFSGLDISIETPPMPQENIDPVIITPLLELSDDVQEVSQRKTTPLLELSDDVQEVSQRKAESSVCHKPRSVSTRKINKGIKATHAEKQLCLKLSQVKKKLDKCRSKIKEQTASLKAAKNIAKNPLFINALENLSNTAKTLTLLQFREHKKKGKGRRFNTEEKILALSIFKQSPKCYRFLRRIFILPTPRTLVKLISQADVRPGINQKIFDQLKNITKKMTMEDKLCVLLFDEMALKANLRYREHQDHVNGFVNNGNTTKSEYADHVQVFMIRGLIRNYKKAISYSFSAAATKGTELAVQLKEIVTKLQDAGLIVVATVCDQGTNNRQAIKVLLNETRGSFLRAGVEPKENILLINNQEIVPLYDPPHLLKCIRNNLITKNLKYELNKESKTAKWDHIELLHKENPGYKSIRLIPKLTDNHVIPTKISKMKVKFATQLFSRTVASNMGYLAEKGILPRECEETADILLFFDKLFDSVNGSYSKGAKQHGKPLLGPVKPHSEHKKMWKEAKTLLNTMKFINKTTEKPETIPCLSNWVWTLDGIEVLLNNLEKKYGVKSVWMRHLNQDPIENFFGAIRSQGCRNINPTPDQFQSAFTTLLINNMSSVHAPGANCEKDYCQALQSFVITEDCKAAPATCFIESIPEINIIDIREKNDPRVKGALDYVSGYFARCAKKNIFKTCSKCTANLLASEENTYIKFREYSGKRWLCSPSQSLIICVSAVQDISDSVLKSNLEKYNIKELIKTLILMFVDFNFIKCSSHKDNLIEYIINLSCRFFINNYVKNINKILNGKRDCDDNEDSYQMKAKKHFHKCLKRPHCNRK